MDIYNNFKPTWLMIKRHKITGLLYFCKTARFNPKTYLGSGIYWKRHLKQHGNQIETIWMRLFNDAEDLVEFATFFSEFYEIVHAKNVLGNKIWANLEIENGTDGMPAGTNRGSLFKEKSKINNTGIKNPSYGKYWWTDGTLEVKSRECPVGWRRGRSSFIKLKVSNTILTNKSHTGSRNGSYGVKWWTNGIDSIKSIECPDGWYRGVGSEFRKRCRNNRSH